MYSGTILLSSIVLVKSVELFISSVTKIAHKFQISGYTISFFLVAIATSLPETVVGITSAIDKSPILSYGVVIGSNIALLTLVVSIPVLFGVKISTRSILRTKDVYYALVFAVLPVTLLIDGVLTRTDGLILLSAYIIYAAVVLRRSHGLESVMEKIEHVNMWKQGILFLFSLGLLLASSEGIVQSALKLSAELGIGLSLVGLSITAIGTSLPEIAFVFGALRGHHHQEILGDVIGSIVANSTLVLGIAAAIFPIDLAHAQGNNVSPILFLVAALLLFIRFARSKEDLNKIEALLLLIFYIGFLAFEFLIA